MHPTPNWLKTIPKLPEFNDNIKLFGGHKQKVAAGWSVDWERHFAFEILFIIEGVQHTELSTHHFDFKEGDILLFPPGLLHRNSCHLGDGLSYFCVHFDIDNPELQRKLITNCSILLNKDNAAHIQIRKTLQEYIKIIDKQEFSLQDKFTIEKLLLELIIHLISYSDCESSQQSGDNHLILAKMIAETIKSNFVKYTHQPVDEGRKLLSLSHVARSLNISESTMLKTFKKMYFISPKQFLNQLKFNEAKYLLNQPEMSIQEIAECIGYQDVSHFSRQFKNWYGKSPSEYRKRAHTAS